MLNGRWVEAARLNGLAAIMEVTKVAKRTVAKTAVTKAKRLNHTIPVIRQLFAHSGNLCAFPGCAQLMINADGKSVCQICHIEGVAGERHDPNMSAEQMAEVGNLILLCYAHHIETNDEAKYTVEILLRMKANHEKKFSNPERAIIEALSDSTDLLKPKRPSNLNRLNKVLNWRLGVAELEGNLELLTELSDKFQLVPLPTRIFVGQVAKRIHKMRNTGHVKDDDHVVGITFNDLKGAFHHDGNRVGQEYLNSMATDLENYGVGGYQEFMGLEGEHMLTLRQPEGWRIWDDLIEFSKKEGIEFDEFIVGLNFSSLAE